MTDRVADELTIRNALARYCYLEDTERFDEWSELFTVDAVAELTGGPIEGRSALAEFALANAPRGGRRMLGNVEIEIDGDSAAVRSDCIFFMPSEDQLRPVVAWRYYDTFVRCGDEWLISQKRAADHLRPSAATVSNPAR